MALLRLTQAELDAALARLSTSQQEELLTLLEIEKREEAERAERFVDDRDWLSWKWLPQAGEHAAFEEYCRAKGVALADLNYFTGDSVYHEFLIDTGAAKSGCDPAKYRDAWEKHHEARARHERRLRSELSSKLPPPPPADSTDIGDWINRASWELTGLTHEQEMEHGCAIWNRAVELAREEGFPPPAEAVAQSMRADPLDAARHAAMRRQPQPRDMLLGDVIAETEVRERQRQAERAQAASALPAEDKLDGFRGVGPLNWLVPGEDS